MRFFSLAIGAAALGLAASGCSTYGDDLARSQHAFEENQHETALAIERMLELDQSHLEPAERARYAYVRGMTDFRIGYKADARHWLAVAKAMDDKTPGSIPADWRTRLDQSLAELDSLVWTGGVESLPTTVTSAKKSAAPKKRRAPKAEEPVEEQEVEETTPPPPKPDPKKSSDDSE
jgi:hypothetical protein